MVLPRGGGRRERDAEDVALLRERERPISFRHSAHGHAGLRGHRGIGLPGEPAGTRAANARIARFRGETRDARVRVAQTVCTILWHMHVTRALIRTIVECVRPEPGRTIADPACGTGGFFLACYDFLTNPTNHELDKSRKAQLKHKTFQGNEIVANTRRLFAS